MIYGKDGTSLSSAFDKNGNSLDYAYDKDGNVIFSASVHPIVPPSKILGEPFVPSLAWRNRGAEQYEVFKNAFMQTDEYAIPLMVSTDAHVNYGANVHRSFHNWNDIQAVNIGLGDLCPDTYSTSALNTYKSSTQEVDNFIGVVGNHDCKKGSETPTQSSIRDYFTSTIKYRKELIQTDDTANCVVYDDVHNVKFICCDWYTVIGDDLDGTMPNPVAKTTVSTWFLNELGKNDGYDIIILQHALFSDNCIHDDGTKQLWADAPPSMERLWEVCKDRKNKRSGSYVDDEGVTHTYDFTNCESDLICTLHGHAHEQLHLREDGLTMFAFNRFYTAYFAILDRTEGKITVWTFHYDSKSDGPLYSMDI